MAPVRRTQHWTTVSFLSSRAWPAAAQPTPRRPLPLRARTHLAPDTPYLSLSLSVCGQDTILARRDPSRPVRAASWPPFLPQSPSVLAPQHLLCNDLDNSTARQSHESGVLCAPLPWLPTASDEGRNALRAVCQSRMPAPRMTSNSSTHHRLLPHGTSPPPFGKLLPRA